MSQARSETSPVEVQSYLKGVDYPASREDLVQAARRNGASGEVLQILQRLPGEKLDSPAAVSHAYAEERGRGRSSS
jgi:hypothetical protein